MELADDERQLLASRSKSQSWEELAVDAATDSALEARATELGLRGVLVVEGSELPAVPVLSEVIRTALEHSLLAGLGPAASREHLQVHVRPGGASTAVARRSVGGMSYRFRVIPAQDSHIPDLLSHLNLEAASGCEVCLLPNMHAILEEYHAGTDSPTNCRLQMEVFRPGVQTTSVPSSPVASV